MTRHQTAFTFFLFFAFSLAIQTLASAEEPAIKVTPYGQVELDTVYSSRNTNPLDPAQFNGYATAAGVDPHESYTFNPRFSVMGFRAETQNSAGPSLRARVEFDFYGSDAVGLIAPRLRLAYIEYAAGASRLTVGQDWTPIAALNPNVLDFSVMGYGGNLWQRIPQITFRQTIGGRLELLGTVMRFERGSSFTAASAPTPFDDPAKMPIVGARAAYQGWGEGGKGLVALSGGYRQYKMADPAKDTITTSLGAVEWAVPVGIVTWSGEAATGEALGDEFFRFGQAINGNKGIHANVGWTQLVVTPIPQWSFTGGYGIDDPKNKDLNGISDTAHYLKNQRYFANVIHPIFAGFTVGLEYTRLMTEWSDQEKKSGNQVMLSFWSSF